LEFFIVIQLLKKCQKYLGKGIYVAYIYIYNFDDTFINKLKKSFKFFIRKFICAENLKANYEVMVFLKLKNIELAFSRLTSPSKYYVYINLS